MSKEQSAQIKGIAIILMFIHHLFGFPDWWISDMPYLSIINIKDTPFIQYIATYSKICVALFTFVSGYGMYYVYQKDNSIKNLWKRIGIFLIKYWMILFLIFYPLNIFILGNKVLSFDVLLGNLFGLYNRLIGFSWYVYFYVIAMLILYLVKKYLPQNIIVFIILVYIPSWVFCKLVYHFIHNEIMTTALINILVYLPVLLLGYVCAKNRLFERLRQSIKLSHGMFLLLGALVIIFTVILKFFMDNMFVDAIVIFFLVYYLNEVLSKCKILVVNRGTNFLGKHSMNLWLLHSIFFFDYTFLQKLVYFPRIPILIIIFAIIILLPVSICLNYLYDFINHKVILIKERSYGK